MDDFLLPILAGIALAAASGFRVFVPMLAASVAAHAGYLKPGAGFDWLATYPAIVSLSAATVVEVAAYYIPWLDHALDTVATPTALAAGTTVMAALAPIDDPAIKWILAAVGGGGAASIVQLGTVGARALSGATTGGLGNPIVATIEHLAAIVLSVLAILVPIVAFLFVLATFYFVAKVIARFRRMRRNRRAAAETGGV